MTPNLVWMVVRVAIIAAACTLLLVVTPHAPQAPDIRVSFIGNSLLFVNDVPRFLEVLSGQRLTQNSCLHGSLNLGSILIRGNGMYEKFVRENPLTSSGFYDYGACTVAQLLLGYDDKLQPLNANEYYMNDGTNPCFVDEAYYYFLKDQFEVNGPPNWDFVVLNDQSTYPGLAQKRSRTIQTLQDTYANYFLQINAKPVFYVTYGYQYNGTNSLGDIPEFTSRVWYGYQQYAETLAGLLPESQQPLIAPVGLAFLVLWEENYGIWERLFYTDNIHPSQHGSFLIGCVLYATIYGEMPHANLALATDMSTLWSRARCMQVNRDGDEQPYPTQTEAYFLYLVAELVVLQGYRPRSLLSEQAVTELEGQYAEQEQQLHRRHRRRVTKNCSIGRSSDRPKSSERLLSSPHDAAHNTAWENQSKSSCQDAVLLGGGAAEREIVKEDCFSLGYQSKG